jgi:hypothetical protein
VQEQRAIGDPADQAPSDIERVGNKKVVDQTA